MKHLAEILSMIQVLKDDCESQVNGLESSDNDVAWNCYDVGNWQSMVNTLETLEQKIKEL